MFRFVIGEARGLIQQRDAIEVTADALLADSSDYKLLRRIPGNVRLLWSWLILSISSVQSQPVRSA